MVDGAAEVELLDGSDAAFDGMLVVVSCAGAVAAVCAGAGWSAGGDVIACDGVSVLGSEAIGGVGVVGAAAALSESAVGVLVAGSPVTLLVPVDGATLLLVERDD